MRNVKLMTFNMLHIDENPANKWEERLGLISNLINREAPDIIGTQECLYAQVRDIEVKHPEYDWIGMGRQGGSHDDYMAIFYKKDYFSVLEYNHFWLSDTPDLIGSKTFGNQLPRMVTWAKFMNKQTGNIFYHMNTHLDYKCEEARIKGAELICEKVKDFDKEVPIFLTGDFNTDVNTTPFEILTKQGPFEDTWGLAKEHINKTYGTKNDFIYQDGGSERIDWILTRGITNVSSIKIVADCIDGKFPSDHFPVVVSCEVGNG